MRHCRRTVRFERKATACLDQIFEDVRASFERVRFDIALAERGARVRHTTSCAFGDTRIDLTECVGGHMQAAAKGFVDIGVTLRGGVLATHPTFESMAGPGKIVTWAAPGHELDVRVKPGTMLASLRIKPERIMLTGQALVGEHFRVAETAQAPVSEIIGSTMARHIMHIYRELTELAKLDISDLVVSAFEDQLASLAVAMMQPELFTADADEANAQRSIATRAAEILQARAMQPVTVTSLAKELGITVRSLQMSFRKHRGESPLQFLLGQRLAVARQRLLNPEQRDNVQSVAMGCGFVNMSKFSSRYRITYGELPSETLERGRRR